MNSVFNSFNDNLRRDALTLVNKLAQCGRMVAESPERLLINFHTVGFNAVVVKWQNGMFAKIVEPDCDPLLA
ncbi:Uncharacterised protein [Cedecea davisae]|nr:Uncharacterised protein [Cedecea davisae]